MWIIHADKLPHRIGELAPVAGILQRLIGGELQSDVREPAAALMLLQKNIDEIRQLVRFLETREKKVLLQFLVIILDEIANDLRRLSDRLRRQIFVRVHATECFSVDEHNSLHYAMLTHEVLGR